MYATRAFEPILKVAEVGEGGWREDPERFSVVSRQEAKHLPIGHANISCGWWAQGRGANVSYSFDSLLTPAE
jgi:hypothetical protein